MEDIFVTNNYKVLKIMYENTLKEENYCPLTQEEIAQRLGVSRAIVNKIFNDLRDSGYISMVTRKKWSLSDRANHIIKITKEL